MVTVHRELEEVRRRRRLPAAPAGRAAGRVGGGLTAAADAVSPVVEGVPVRQRLVATYYDTADLRLACAGLALRRRTGGDDGRSAGADRAPAGGRPVECGGHRWWSAPGVRWRTESVPSSAANVATPTA